MSDSHTENGPRAGDVSLLVDRGAPRVEEKHALVMEGVDVVEGDLDVWLVGVLLELGEVDGCGRM